MDVNALGYTRTISVIYGKDRRLQCHYYIILYLGQCLEITKYSRKAQRIKSGSSFPKEDTVVCFIANNKCKKHYCFTTQRKVA